MFNPAVPPAWVSGGATGDGSVRKFHRAVETLRKEGKEVTEEAVKELYIKMNGLIVEDSAEDTDTESEEAPVRRGRKPKTEE